MYTKHNDLISVSGWAGSLLILAGYTLLMNDVILGNSLEYISLNFLGSFFLAINLYFREAKGPLFLQVCFILVSLFGFWKLL